MLLQNKNESMLTEPPGKLPFASGGSSLDGSVISETGDGSDQNGLRRYSPVRNIPPQPNFDDTGLESFLDVSVGLFDDMIMILMRE
ncbi:unnamed protein product [Nippostrongylus brasiliensis]|uniref:Uncharacterized protein n=1 Tax=Nippostrongylus brasiliensis TaxID=27835 RepID=A0A0N4XSU3_NIPBR|nr:unnamed protein product [Nippostrongylus brasiliensis]